MSNTDNIPGLDLLDLVYDLDDLGIKAEEAGKYDFLEIPRITPERKDIKRAHDLAKLPSNQGGGNAGGPLASKAASMSKLIQHADKMARRAMAIAIVWGTEGHNTTKGPSNPWKLFKDIMIMNGFRSSQIEEIKNRAKVLKHMA